GSAAAEDDFRNVDEGFDVVDDGRLAEQAGLRGERRLVARLAAVALDRIEQRGFLAANISASAAAQLDIKAQAAAENVMAQQSVGASRGDGVPEPFSGQRIFAANVDVALLRVGGERRDGHALDDGERISLHHDAVFERAW